MKLLSKPSPTSWELDLHHCWGHLFCVCFVILYCWYTIWPMSPRIIKFISVFGVVSFWWFFSCFQSLNVYSLIIKNWILYMVCNPFWLVFLLLCKQICHIFKKNKMVVICSNFKIFLYFTTTGTLTSWRCKNDHHLHAFNVRLGIIDSHETCSLVIGLVS